MDSRGPAFGIGRLDKRLLGGVICFLFAVGCLFLVCAMVGSTTVARRFYMFGQSSWLQRVAVIIEKSGARKTVLLGVNHCSEHVGIVVITWQ